MGNGKMAYALAGGIASAAGANLEKLRTEAKEAKEMRMASFNRESAQLLQTDQQNFMNKENVRKEGIQVGQFDATMDAAQKNSDRTYTLAQGQANLASDKFAYEKGADGRAFDQAVKMDEYATDKQKKQWLDKATAFEKILREKSAGNTLSSTETTMIEAMKSGLDPKTFEKAVAKIDPKVLELANNTLLESKGGQEKLKSDPIGFAEQARDIAETMSGLNPDGTAQLVQQLKDVMAGKLSEVQILKAVEQKKLTVSEADFLIKNMPPSMKATPLPQGRGRGIMEGIPTGSKTNIPQVSNSGKEFSDTGLTGMLKRRLTDLRK